jgi:hypothetical protein
MSSDFELKQQREALLALLPMLKNELHFAGYRKTDKAGLFARIDQQYEALKAGQLSLDNIDPFAVDIKQPIAALKGYQFAQEVYHSDAMGHCQVELTIHDQPYGLEHLLNQIDKDQQWPACFEMLQNQPRSWLIALSEQLENNKQCHTLCQIELMKLIGGGAVVQNAGSWYWSSENKVMIPNVLEHIGILIDHHYPDAVDKEISLSILLRVKAKLETILGRRD